MFLGGGTVWQQVDHSSLMYRSDLFKATPGLDEKIRTGGHENVPLRVTCPKEPVNAEWIPEQAPCAGGRSLYGRCSTTEVDRETVPVPKVRSIVDSASVPSEVGI
jgi:hypothetical protein